MATTLKRWVGAPDTGAGSGVNQQGAGYGVQDYFLQTSEGKKGPKDPWVPETVISKLLEVTLLP